MALVVLAAWLAFFHTPTQESAMNQPPLIQHPEGMPPVQDDRASFRKVLTEVALARTGSPDWRPVEQILHDLGHEGVGTPQDEQVEAPPKLAVILVSGVLWECVSDVALPFGAGQHGLPPEGDASRDFLADYDYLKQAGVNAEVVEVVRVRGIANSKTNAERVAQAILQHQYEARPVVVVAYSKGVPDTLQALLDLGDDVPANLKAVVSVAGVVSGSPLGDWLDRYRWLLLNLPRPSACKRVDNDFLESITRKRCLPWLSEHWGKMPKQVGFYSLVTFEEPERMHWFLRLLYARLAMVDPRNDSHVLAQDQVFPGGKLLGYVQSDHWAVSLPFNRSRRSVWNRLLAHNNAFPREVLLESILRYVEGDLASGAQD